MPPHAAGDRLGSEAECWCCAPLVQDAAQAAARLRALEAELGPAALAAGLITTSSTAVTHGIRVQTQRCARDPAQLPLL
jgi:hypothetical protein